MSNYKVIQVIKNLGKAVLVFMFIMDCIYIVMWGIIIMNSYHFEHDVPQEYQQTITAPVNK
jgi:hypothetical protein